MFKTWEWGHVDLVKHLLLKKTKSVSVVCKVVKGQDCRQDSFAPGRFFCNERRMHFRTELNHKAFSEKVIIWMEVIVLKSLNNVLLDPASCTLSAGDAHQLPCDLKRRKLVKLKIKTPDGCSALMISFEIR